MKRAVRTTLMLAIVLVLGFPGIAPGAGSDATVSGVVSGDSGTLASATVEIDYLGKGGMPRQTALLTSGLDGSWSYSGKAGDCRLTFSADGYSSTSEVLHLDARTSYAVNAELAPTPPPTGTITGRISSASGAGMSGYAFFYQQDPDGTWPTSYQWQTATGDNGTYTSGPLPLGTYKVRLFTMHTGVQWYLYVSTMESATPVVLDTAGQVATGIDAVYPPPTP